MTNDAAIPNHLGHDFTAPPVMWSYYALQSLRLCVCVFVCVCARVCLSYSALSLHYRCRVFHTALFLLYGCCACVCMCVFVYTIQFAQLQTQHSTPLIHTVVSTDKRTQSCKFFTNTALFIQSGRKYKFTSLSFCEYLTGYIQISG